MFSYNLETFDDVHWINTQNGNIDIIHDDDGSYCITAYVGHFDSLESYLFRSDDSAHAGYAPVIAEYVQIKCTHIFLSARSQTYRFKTIRKMTQHFLPELLTTVLISVRNRY